MTPSALAKATAATLGAAMAFALPANARSARNDIGAANAVWVEAIRTQDMVLLGRIMAPEYRLTYAHRDSSVDRARWLKNFARMKMNAYRISVTQIRMPEPGRADLFVTGYWDSTVPSGKQIRERFKARDSWVRRDARWVATGRHVLELQVLGQ